MKKLKISLVALMAFALTAGVTYATQQQTKANMANDCWQEVDQIGLIPENQSTEFCDGLGDPCCYKSATEVYLLP